MQQHHNLSLIHIYFLVRIVGKYLGSTLGALVTNATPEIKKYFGLALIPQAGVSIGLAVLGQRMLPAASGEMLSTIILSSGILYEMVGPACAKAAIRLSGSIPEKKSESKKAAKKAAVQDIPTENIELAAHHS